MSSERSIMHMAAVGDVICDRFMSESVIEGGDL